MLTGVIMHINRDKKQVNSRSELVESLCTASYYTMAIVAITFLSFIDSPYLLNGNRLDKK